MRLIYIDPVLTDFRGHWISHCRSIIQGFNLLNVETVVVAAASLNQALIAELRGLPLFRISPYAQVSDDPLCGHLLSFNFVKDETKQDLDRLQGIRDDDLLYFEASSPASLAGCVEWYRSLRSQRPKMIVSLIEQTGLVVASSNDNTELSLINKNPELWRYVGLSISHDLGITFITVEDAYADIYTKLLGHPVDRLPHPFGLGGQSCNPTFKNRISFLGAQRPIKGFGMARDIFNLLDRKFKDFEFFVHDSRGEMLADLDFFKNLSSHDTRVTVDSSPKNPNDWIEMIRGAGCVIAPYDPRFYSIASSGIANECLSAGVPIVASPGICIGKQLNENGLAYLVANSYSPEAFVERILWYFEHKKEVSEAISAACASWNKSNGPEKFARACLSLTS
ncbi:glycosyltransferase [Fluviibacter phosphoraccumulans]|uniref:glycosyltransferase n=1 Tax=Fluviibacter phosphoraccumulans TaxID=1751046 RepID=UPI0010B476D2|nr:glycosyltransferase [Fluviibacter phosphoraccumulans]BCA65850.1 hypothetical protein SHINM1_014520 [Fluviibacter phosphoraccumulans]